MKLTEQIEVDTNKDIQRFKLEAKKMRDKATVQERKEGLALVEETRRTKSQADKDALQKKRDADQIEKDILTKKIKEEEE
jgi:hypothetical protein